MVTLFFSPIPPHHLNAFFKSKPLQGSPRLGHENKENGFALLEMFKSDKLTATGSEKPLSLDDLKCIFLFCVSPADDGKLSLDEFQAFFSDGTLNEEELEKLFHTIDSDNTRLESIHAAREQGVHDIFEWLHEGVPHTGGLEMCACQCAYYDFAFLYQLVLKPRLRS